MTSENEGSAKKGFSKFTKQPMAIQARKIRRTIQIKTLEGTMMGNPGDWLIVGIKGEKYPCKDDVFRQSYYPSGPDKCGYCAFGEVHESRHEAPCDMHEMCLFEWKDHVAGISGGEAME